MKFLHPIRDLFRELTMLGQPMFGRARVNSADILTPAFPAMQPRADGAVKWATPFEQSIISQFKIHAASSSYDALIVLLTPYSGARTHFTDPTTREIKPATFQTMAASWKQAQWAHEQHLAVPVADKSEYLAMILDLKEPLEKQIPGWAPGTMELPEQFIRAPVICEAAKMKTNPASVLPDNVRAARGRTVHGHIYTPPAYMRGVITGGPRQG